MPENDTITLDTLAEQVTETVQNDSTVQAVVETVEMLRDTPVSEWLPQLVRQYLVPFAIKLVIAIIVLIIGRWLIKIAKKWMANGIMSRKGDPTLHKFLSNLISFILNFILIIFIISILGVNTSSLVALLASAGLAIGMALSGTLQNFAGGVVIMLFRPFKVGDYISAQGQEGVVKEIQIFNTIVLTMDNKVIHIPNGILSTGVMTVFTKEETRRVEWTVSISYGDDYDKAKAVLLRLCNEDPRILKNPAPFVEIALLNNSSVDIKMRVWVKSADYWPVFFSMNEKVYKSLPKEGLTFPFPQVDVHMS
ncbi:MAG: mechanosensitive ion channel [Bacteroidales bacterium]|nr:mechanosensitive ion channel [Bacteroidales bacterium]